MVTEVLADNGGMLRVLERTGLAWSRTIAAGVTTLRATLPTPTEGELNRSEPPQA